MMQTVRTPLTDRFGQAPAVDVLELHQHAPAVIRANVSRVSERAKQPATEANKPPNAMS